jgi:isopenicillin-N N-acyltransferase-like protein
MEGTHYEMGRQYGSQCRARIRNLVAIFDGLILKEKNIQKGKAVAKEAVPHVRAAAPELLEEVEGIASGAGLGFDDVFRLNCSVELFSWQGCMERAEVSTVPEASSSFAVHAREGTLVAWNMDWWRLWLPYIVLLRGAPKEGPRFMAFAFAGCVGRPGMSERVAVSANFLPYRSRQGPQWDGPGVPYNFLCRMMLKQKSTAEAVAAAVGVKRMACLNYTVGDAQGNICCVETTPRDHDMLYPQEEFIVHANSYHSPKFEGIPEKDQEQRDPRAFHARQLLRRHRDRLDRHTLASVQTAHFPGQSTGVCVHQKLQDREGITLLSFIARVGAGEMWAAHGPPCEHEFLHCRLPQT